MRFENKLNNSKYVSKTLSVYDTYATINSSMRGNKEPVYPEQLTQINFINSLVTGSGSDPTSQLVVREKNSVKIMVFPVNLKNNTLDAISQLVENFNQENDNIEIKITGIQYLMRELNQSMITNQTKTVLIAFSLIFILLFVSLRKIKPAIISLLPIAFTIVIISGFMGYSGISLNLFTATIFSITIGVGIDYAVHFTSWMSFRKQGLKPIEAVNKSYSYTARPILVNAFGLAIGLSALLFSPLRIHLYVSLLMWVSMIAGVFLSLSFLPTLLKKIKS